MEINLPEERQVTPTPMQEAAFNKYLECLKKGERPILGKIMMAVGYSPYFSESPTNNLTSKPGWQVLKKRLDSMGAVQAFNDLVSQENEDKRTRLASAIEITKIQGGYPAQENKVVGLFGDLEKLRNNDNKSENITGEDKLPTTPGSGESAGVPE
jgi:hypothetical protein